MNFAYEKYLAVAEADTKLLSGEELAAFDSMKAEADSAYEEKALELIGAALEEFEASVAVEDLSAVEALRNAKAKRAAVPDLKYLIVEEDRGEFAGRYEAADEKLKAEPLYYVETTGTSWTASETEDGIRLDNKLGEQNNATASRSFRTLSISTASISLSTLQKSAGYGGARWTVNIPKAFTL